MYENFFELKEKPFSLAPDPRFLYLSRVHREALANLIYGVRERKGFMVLTGEVGAGKTTLIRALLSRLGKDTLSAFIFNSRMTVRDLFTYIFEEFDIKADGRGKGDMVIQLNHFLIERLAQGKNTLLIIDEAQNLSLELLEEIRLLSNLETSREKLLQIILVGQPELASKLKLPQLRQLDQRVSLRYHLGPLNRAETREYIRQRLTVAGSTDNSIFTETAIGEIYRYSKGVPRVINLLCDHALLSAYASDKRRINPPLVKEALRIVRGEDGLSGGVRPHLKPRLGMTIFLISTLILALAGAFYFDGWGSRVWEMVSRLASRI